MITSIGLTRNVRARTRLVAATSALLLGAIAAGGCSDDGGSGNGSGDPGTLTIYSGREEEYVGPLYDRFTDDTGIKLDVRYGDSADLALLIDEEGEASPADIFFSQSPGAIEYVGEAGLLSELPSESLDQVIDGFASEDRLWVGSTARQRVLVYNTDEVKKSELPSSVFGLTESEFEGRVGLAPTNGSFQDFITAMRQLEGEERAAAWLEGMVDNGAQTYADNGAIVAAVARGEIEMGLVNHYYIPEFLDEEPGAPIRSHVFPAKDVGSLLIASGLGVLESSDTSEEAVEFVDYVLRPESQEYFVEHTFEYPLVPQVDSPAGLPPVDEVESVDYDIQNLGGGLERTVELISESGLE
jgi:iron(III) transport system substrate-binding protein